MTDRKNYPAMRDGFVTPFWRSVSQSLPQAVRKRYLPQLQSAEGFDLALDRMAGAWRSLHRLFAPSNRGALE
jgi:hypothetical protein